MDREKLMRCSYEIYECKYVTLKDRRGRGGEETIVCLFVCVGMMMKGEFNKRPPKNKGMAMMMENFPRGELYIWKR